MEQRRRAWFVRSYLFFIFSTAMYHSFASNSISAGNSLHSMQTLISIGEKFELGFFSPGNSGNYYLGIWYKQIFGQKRTYVWVANRDDPLDVGSCELRLSIEGHLYLFGYSQKLSRFSQKELIGSTNANPRC
ncbi:hypothetical protein ACHQM5_003867 [Ranunculus cassubicifolius]